MSDATPSTTGQTDLDRFLVHAVVEDDMPGLPRDLGVVHGGVGVAEHVVRPPVAPGTRP